MRTTAQKSGHFHIFFPSSSRYSQISSQKLVISVPFESQFTSVSPMCLCLFCGRAEGSRSLALAMAKKLRLPFTFVNNMEEKCVDFSQLANALCIVCSMIASAITRCSSHKCDACCNSFDEPCCFPVLWTEEEFQRRVDEDFENHANSGGRGGRKISSTHNSRLRLLQQWLEDGNQKKTRNQAAKRIPLLCPTCAVIARGDSNNSCYGFLDFAMTSFGVDELERKAILLPEGEEPSASAFPPRGPLLYTAGEGVGKRDAKKKTLRARFFH